jgi:hypothetical protein
MIIHAQNGFIQPDERYMLLRASGVFMFSLEVSTECFSLNIDYWISALIFVKKSPKNNPYFFKNFVLKTALIFHKILLESLVY